MTEQSPVRIRAGEGHHKRVTDTSRGPWTGWRKMSRHGRCIKFIETYCRAPKGKGHGKPIRLAGWQKEGLEEMLASDVDASAESFPRGNGKSTIEAAVGVWATFDDDETGAPSVPVIATTVMQAKRSVYNTAVSMVRHEPELETRSIIYTAIGANSIVVPSVEGEMFPMSNDIDGLQGLDPSLAIVDEIGFQPLDAWGAMLMAGGKRSRSLIMGKGTPGVDRDNALFQIRKTLADGGAIPRFHWREFAADPGCPIDDRGQWRLANPALRSGFLRMSALQTDLRLMPEARFRIFRLGQWVDGFQSWLGEDGRSVWDGLRDPRKLVLNAPTWVGIDVGIKRDSTAVAAVQYREDGRLHAHVRLWVPGKGEPVDVTDVMQYLRDLRSEYKVGAISFDPRFFDVPAKMLHDDGLPMVEIPQSVERMTPIIGDLYELIMTAGLSHDGDEVVAEHLLNAIPRHSDRGFTLQKSKSRGRIDATIAIALAVDRARHRTKPRAPVVIL